MDIESPKRRTLLYQTGDKKTRGVIDLRHFDDAKKTAPARAGKVFYEIKASRPQVPHPRPLNTVAVRSTAQPIPQPTRPTEAVRVPTRPIVAAPRPAAPVPRIESDSSAVALASLPQVSEVGRLHFKRNQPVAARTRRAPALPAWPEPALRRPLLRFAGAALMVPLVIFTFAFTQGLRDQEGRVLGASTAAFDNLKAAAGFALASDFENTSAQFSSANANFAAAQGAVNGIGLGIGEAIGKLPLSTPVSTARSLTGAGENIALAGGDLSRILAQLATGLDNAAGLSLSTLVPLAADIQSAAGHLSAAAAQLGQAELRYVPAGLRNKLALGADALPLLARNFTRLGEDYPLLLKLLGQDHAQKYLLLFENNTELRATGGFIGSYGILDVEDGKIASLKIDGIFNPDGQLKEKVVPPMPLQKISAAWSLHDSNWFADYPTSARKAALFYEKTGGPTVDGVIVVTPETIKKLLAITGPIELPEYNLIITAENFVTLTQNQVEVADKAENNPKRILSDLAPRLLQQLFQSADGSQEAKVARLLAIAQAVEESLAEKHVLLYHRDESIEAMLAKRGWAGELVQSATGDYLSVVNTNINGYKTDAVMQEDITLETAISPDGTVIDTLTIRRRNNGGSEDYDWYNRVNADFLRVYVPQGSVLLSATGHTREEHRAPMDYASFKTDPDVVASESTLRIDPESGTRIFEESGKTVFGNWVYVSPQEEATVVYRYQLPFKVDFGAGARSADAYSATIQKQAGSLGSSFAARIVYPDGWQTAFRTGNLDAAGSLSTRLTRDLLYAAIFQK